MPDAVFFRRRGVGSRGFVKGGIGRFRDHFGPRRQDRAHRMLGLAPEMFTARNHGVDVFGSEA